MATVGSAMTKAQYPLMMTDSSDANPFSASAPTLADRLSQHSNQASMFYDYCRSSVSVSSMLQAVAVPGQQSKHTVLVPVNKALMALARKPHQGPPTSSRSTTNGKIEMSQEDEERSSAAYLERFVKRSIIKGEVSWETPDKVEQMTFETMDEGQSIRFERTNDGWLANGVAILDRDDAASNGELLFIDGVLTLDD
ncbi:hypothetical protein OIO90_000709 [Microbotryomycetes sp. JL221]|nr:hypothetical protein OIO90_000709 [Microbotryomycetes sp. JL221]